MSVATRLVWKVSVLMVAAAWSKRAGALALRSSFCRRGIRRPASLSFGAIIAWLHVLSESLARACLPLVGKGLKTADGMQRAFAQQLRARSEAELD